jgi:hypothetical protein
MLPSGTNSSLALPVVNYMTYHSTSVAPTLGFELAASGDEAFSRESTMASYAFFQRGLR